MLLHVLYTVLFYVVLSEGNFLTFLDRAGESSPGISAQDAGIYTCNVSVESDFGVATANLTVQGKHVLVFSGSHVFFNIAH